MTYEHKPVLLEETIKGLNIKKDGLYVDGTLGGAGHSTEILKRLNGEGLLIGFDQDDTAIKVATKRLEEYGQLLTATSSDEDIDRQSEKPRFAVVHTNYENLDDVFRQMNIEGADGILLDIGVSSYQLDEAERGFGYMQDAPLDMRMDRRNELSAWTVVNKYSKTELENVIKEYGEERWSSRIASFIVEKRKEAEISTTGELVEVIKAAIPAAARRNGPHPAKRTFQAIRIEVNKELDVLYSVIQKAIPLLNPGGRLCIITFHSLEDRIVKQEFKKFEQPCTCPPDFPICVCGKEPQVRIITKKPIEASQEELEENPRARSARLRIVEKLVIN